MVRIDTKIAKALNEDRPFWSFEFFPPKTEIGVMNLYDRMERMYALGPEFIDVTWGAGGSTSDLTMQDAKNCGIKNILALRGDPPRGQANWVKVETGFAYALDLVKYIRKEYGDYFCIGVAAYPEGHDDSLDKEDDIKYLKLKQEAGANYVVTQLFYDVDFYLNWLEKCKEAGITIPILPGMMPIQNYGGFQRMTFQCKTRVPKKILDELEPIKDDDKAVKQYGIALGIEMVKQLQANGVKGFHFYTLNLEKSVRLILEGLKFVAPLSVIKPLPWNPSLARNREKENVRPIFWRNRTKSYILRTEAWDDFPNGRWGDSRSPAYGDLDGYGIALKYPLNECLESWNHPTSVYEIANLFVKYITGDVKFLPWSDSPLALESNTIRDKLEAINSAGFLTINSQPAVDGVPSSDSVFGWGPKNGFVYQKAYLEFFVAPEMLSKLIAKIGTYPFLTYYAINKLGDLKTNTESDSTTAVTWGVFPGQEIVQPTIVEAVSFKAWKDEAFQLWKQWGGIYPDDSPSSKIISEVYNNWYLMNVVDNNYKDKESIFEVFHGLNL
ncbi:hypothetical protein HK099_007648 [Clydaea vesicula]|uniref:MTHFR SAM-binding regulatory domain-containing protein n=1 Tax=Clydaea vesicula TaxID=447962 RepID=A0AAD5U5A9_9FUNG|nr:hypothetical protein HK099_007648 [Clydaea vesicula]